MPPRQAGATGHSAFVRNKLAKKGQTAQTKKEHGYDARNYHQNANRVGIHSLTTFQCPVCSCKNTVRVSIDKKEGKAVVKCSYCMGLDPMPEDLPYPYETVFRPKEVVADAFFRFDNAYRKLLAQQGEVTVVTVGASTRAADRAGGQANAHAQGLIGHLLDALPSDAEEHSGDDNNQDVAESEGQVDDESHTNGARPSQEAQPAEDDGMVNDLEDFFNDSD